MGELKALVFDCDGVIAETERDGHRAAFNRVFAERGIPAEWGVEEYGELVRVAGGKERMKAYFSRHEDLVSEFGLDDEAIKALHRRKTEIFMEMSEKGELPARPGIKRLVKEAHEKGILLAVCSTSNGKSVTSLIKAVLGEEGFGMFDAIFAGDIVNAKKPAPDIYNLVKDRWGLDGSRCFVVEDSRNGLLAAKAAGMHCIVTVSYYSAEESFDEADIVVSSLGDPGMAAVEYRVRAPGYFGKPSFITLDDLKKIVEQEG